jgi:hypothetical protein
MQWIEVEEIEIPSKIKQNRSMLSNSVKNEINMLLQPLLSTVSLKTKQDMVIMILG